MPRTFAMKKNRAAIALAATGGPIFANAAKHFVYADFGSGEFTFFNYYQEQEAGPLLQQKPSETSNGKLDYTDIFEDRKTPFVNVLADSSNVTKNKGHFQDHLCKFIVNDCKNIQETDDVIVQAGFTGSNRAKMLEQKDSNNAATYESGLNDFFKGLKCQNHKISMDVTYDNIITSTKESRFEHSGLQWLMLHADPQQLYKDLVKQNTHGQGGLDILKNALRQVIVRGLAKHQQSERIGKTAQTIAPPTAPPNAIRTSELSKIFNEDICNKIRLKPNIWTMEVNSLGRWGKASIDEVVNAIVRDEALLIQILALKFYRGHISAGSGSAQLSDKTGDGNVHPYSEVIDKNGEIVFRQDNPFSVVQPSTGLVLGMSGMVYGAKACNPPIHEQIMTVSQVHKSIEETLAVMEKSQQPYDEDIKFLQWLLKRAANDSSYDVTDEDRQHLQNIVKSGLDPSKTAGARKRNIATLKRMRIMLNKMLTRADNDSLVFFKRDWVVGETTFTASWVLGKYLEDTRP